MNSNFCETLHEENNEFFEASGSTELIRSHHNIRNQWLLMLGTNKDASRCTGSVASDTGNQSPVQDLKNYASAVKNDSWNPSQREKGRRPPCQWDAKRHDRDVDDRKVVVVVVVRPVCMTNVVVDQRQPLHLIFGAMSLWT